MASPTYNCIFAGIIGAASGVVAKAAGTFNGFENINLVKATSLLLYMGMIMLNWKSLSFYVRGMQTLPSLQASVITSSTNSLFMGCFACLLFRETLSLNWVIGMCFMLIGVFIMCKASIKKTDNLKKD